MTYPDLLLTADELLSALEDREIYSVTIKTRQVQGVFPHISIHLADVDPDRKLHDLFEVCSLLGLEGTKVTRAGYALRGLLRTDTHVEVMG